jgi:hypothetical protein
VEKLGILSLQRKIESALLEAGVLSLRMFFSVENLDTVRLYGITPSEKERETVLQVIRNMKVIKNIKDQLTVFKY